MKEAKHDFLPLASREDALLLDQEAIQNWGMDASLLMELAGAAVARQVALRTGSFLGQVLVLCGPGNNGGDGYVAARHLANLGAKVTTLSLGPPDENKTAKKAYETWQRYLEKSGESTDTKPGEASRHVQLDNEGPIPEQLFQEADLIVDALFGVGLGRPLGGQAALLIEHANAKEGALKVAIDLPSGLNASTGQALGTAFQADVTLALGIQKAGFYFNEGPLLTGEVLLEDISWPLPMLASYKHRLRLAQDSLLSRLVPKRPLLAHKGTFGHVAVIGGAPKTEGAAILAAIAGFRVGAGRLTWASLPTAVTQAPHSRVNRPMEIMEVVLDHETPSLPSQANAIVCGPGLGQSAFAKKIVQHVLDDPRPLILDADGINILGKLPEKQRDHWVLTPHPLEAARLLQTTTQEIELHRVEVAERIAERYHATVVLKGACTVIASPKKTTTVFRGLEPTLSVAGTGDVLAGAIGGLVAQGLSIYEATLLAVGIHQMAGRSLGIAKARRGVLARELADQLPLEIAALS